MNQQSRGIINKTDILIQRGTAKRYFIFLTKMSTTRKTNSKTTRYRISHYLSLDLGAIKFKYRMKLDGKKKCFSLDQLPKMLRKHHSCTRQSPKRKQSSSQCFRPATTKVVPKYLVVEQIEKSGQAANDDVTLPEIHIRRMCNENKNTVND